MNTMTARAAVRQGPERSWPATKYRVFVGQAQPGAEQIDVTGGLVSAIAHALWEARGGDPVSNWAAAEGALDALCAEANSPKVSPPQPKPSSDEPRGSTDARGPGRAQGKRQAISRSRAGD